MNVCVDPSCHCRPPCAWPSTGLICGCAIAATFGCRTSPPEVARRMRGAPRESSPLGSYDGPRSAPGVRCDRRRAGLGLRAYGIDVIGWFLRGMSCHRLRGVPLGGWVWGRRNWAVFRATSPVSQVLGGEREGESIGLGGAPLGGWVWGRRRGGVGRAASRVARVGGGVRGGASLGLRGAPLGGWVWGRRNWAVFRATSPVSQVLGGEREGESFSWGQGWFRWYHS